MGSPAPALGADAASGSSGADAASGGSGADAASGGSGADAFVAFDICPANRVLNSLAALEGRNFDEDGVLAAGGRVDPRLLEQLNALPYYNRTWPKSLANEFGTETVLPLVRAAGLSTTDALRTYVEHIAVQVRRAVEALRPGAAIGAGAGADSKPGAGAGADSRPGAGAGADSRPGAGAGADSKPGAGAGTSSRLLATGGGAHNSFLIGRLREELSSIGVEIVVPDPQLADYKEALVMALIGVLRWREENNVLASVTGASRDSIGGAVYIGS